MIDRPLASDRSYEVLQKRRRANELPSPPAHQPNRRLQAPRGSTRDAILRERFTGESEPLTFEVGSKARHV